MMTYDMELITPEFQERNYDYFILAPNIEKRSRAFFLFGQNRIVCSNFLLADYQNFHVNNSKEQEASFYNDFDNCSKKIMRVTSDVDLFRCLNELHIGSSNTVGVDITGFSVPAIYCLMNYLKNQCHISALDVYYTEPKNYVYEKGYIDSYHPENKYRICEPIKGYINSGKNPYEILTIFLGFDGGLAGQVYGKIGEDGKEIIKVIAVNGFPSYTAKLKDISLYNNEALLNSSEPVERMTTTASNPFDTYNLLCKIKKESKGILMNICTIGAKPMALGSCLFALDHMDSVKVTYPFYTKTKFDINEEAGKKWRYGVSL